MSQDSQQILNFTLSIIRIQIPQTNALILVSIKYLTKASASIQACKTRMILTEQNAVDIFRIKLANDSSGSNKRVGATRVAQLFGVSDKAIRDIWKGRT